MHWLRRAGRDTCELINFLINHANVRSRVVLMTLLFYREINNELSLRGVTVRWTKDSILIRPPSAILKGIETGCSIRTTSEFENACDWNYKFN